MVCQRLIHFQSICQIDFQLKPRYLRAQAYVSSLCLHQEMSALFGMIFLRNSKTVQILLFCFGCQYNLKSSIQDKMTAIPPLTKEDYEFFLSGVAEMQTPLGHVAKIKLNAPIPKKWRKMTLEEGKQLQPYISKLLEEWSVVAFEKGKIDGPGYGNKIHKSYGKECGELFIIKTF